MIARLKFKCATFIFGLICVTIAFCLSVNGFTPTSAGLTGTGMAFLLTAIPL